MNYRTRQNRSQAPTFFFAPPDDIDGQTLTLTGGEAKHAITVCRLKKGAQITVTDGDGNAYDCEITATKRDVVQAAVIRPHRLLGEPLVTVTLGVGVGKPATIDWIVEKAVELGAAAIVPIRCEHSAGLTESASVKRRVSRWRRLALSAMKQCLRSVLPPGHDNIDVATAAAMIDDHQMSFIADPGGRPLSEAGSTHLQVTKTMLFVGPEMGFTDTECSVLTNAGAQPFTLGPRRLRADTAAMTSLTLLMRALGEL